LGCARLPVSKLKDIQQLGAALHPLGPHLERSELLRTENPGEVVEKRLVAKKRAESADLGLRERLTSVLVAPLNEERGVREEDTSRRRARSRSGEGVSVVD